MRIACVHVPQLSLQSLTRVDSALRGAAVAVVGAGVDPAAGQATGARRSIALHSPIVLACSRAAWGLGVRLGMTATAARSVSSAIQVVAADPALERETVRSIGDALLGQSPVVDIGGRVGPSGAHLAIYCKVPGKTRGTTFGERLIALLDGFGLAARVGIADDRFTAWVAAAHAGDGGAARPGGAAAREDRGVISVPRGGSAAFLAPRPLSLLAITPEVQHMLEALGVRTLGEFAALPAPSVARPFEADYQALARGDSGCALRPYAPEAPIREELVIGSAGSLFSGAHAAAVLAERVARRLTGRGRGAARLEVSVFGELGERIVPITPEQATASPHALLALLAPLVGEALGAHARLRVQVLGEAVVGAVSDAAAVEQAGGAEVGAAGGAGAANATRLAPAGLALVAAAGTARPAPGELAPLALPLRGLLWQPSPPAVLRAERRDAHRRTRQARLSRSALLRAQPPLFGNAEG